MYRCLPRQNHSPSHGLLRKCDQRKTGSRMVYSVNVTREKPEVEMTHKLQARVNVNMC